MKFRYGRRIETFPQSPPRGQYRERSPIRENCFIKMSSFLNTLFLATTLQKFVKRSTFLLNFHPEIFKFFSNSLNNLYVFLNQRRINGGILKVVLINRLKYRFFPILFQNICKISKILRRSALGLLRPPTRPTLLKCSRNLNPGGPAAFRKRKYCLS